MNLEGKRIHKRDDGTFVVVNKKNKKNNTDKKLRNKINKKLGKKKK